MLRFIQIFVPDGTDIDVDLLLDGRDVLGRWFDHSPDHRQILFLLVPAEETEAIMDRFAHAFSSAPGFHLVLLPVEAVLPRPAPTQVPPPDSPDDFHSPPPRKYGRVSREELYSEAEDGIEISRGFVAMTLLSAVVAAVGLHRNDVAVLIGAMVIAPLLGPNVAMALATTLGDVPLLRRALKTNVLGLCAALTLALILGYIVRIPLDAPAIVARTHVGPGDIVLALAAGVAGSLAFTLGLSQTLIGVMVAVALMPPLVVFGMLLGQGAILPALHAALLLTTNIICVNLACVATFLLQGVRPMRWWEEAHAKQAARRALLIWSILLAALATLLLWAAR